MGVDFLQNSRQTIIKHVDKNRVRLSTPDLFTSFPDRRRKAVVATVLTGGSVVLGEVLIVQAKGSVLSLSRGNTVVATLDKPPAELVSEIRRTGGLAGGKVQRIHRRSGKAEIELS
ncbi:MULTISPECIES: hypothetical protein [unclassified Sinorhizobium]|uniref:hypothetical protein n=1 Tax=unclassified Sinorhizobium TaxID=2613772 RepID=UPI003525DCC1